VIDVHVRVRAAASAAAHKDLSAVLLAL